MGDVKRPERWCICGDSKCVDSHYPKERADQADAYMDALETRCAELESTDREQVHRRRRKRYMEMRRRLTRLRKRRAEQVEIIKVLRLELCGYKAEYADNTAWIDEAKKTMDAQAEIVKGLEVDLKDTRKALPDLKTIALEKAKTIKRLMKAWRVLSQGGCIDPRNGQEQDAVKELDGYLYLEIDIDKEENRGPTETDEPAGG